MHRLSALSESPRERLRRQLAPHVRSALVDAIAGRVTPEEATDHLIWLADLYAGHVAAVEQRAGDA